MLPVFEVPAVSVQKLAYSSAAVPEPSGSNASRHAWRAFRRLKYGWSIPTSSFKYALGNDEYLDVPYYSPKDIFKYMVTNHPSLLVGGVIDHKQRARHLQAFWAAHRLLYPNHRVYGEHPHSLCQVIPFCIHGDEGRGKRRGNTIVLSVESVIGIHTSVDDVGWLCDCCPSDHAMSRFQTRATNMCALWEDCILSQKTNMQGHSYLQHYPVFVLPGSMYKQHTGLLQACLQQMSIELRQCFFEGFQDDKGHCYFGALVGSKGDLKWIAKAAQLKRCFEHVGRKRDIEMCHECGAGSQEHPFEELTTEFPSWTQTIHSQRPWDEDNPPHMSTIPYNLSEPESQLKRDVFHLCKVGIYRDFVGSAIAWFASVGYFGRGDVDTKLERAHSVFALFCQTTKRTPALRSFNKRFFNYLNLTSFPWTNSKGSDTMHLVAWIQVFSVACRNSPVHRDHLEVKDLMHQTAMAASNFFHNMNNHGLFLKVFPCGVSLWAEVRTFIRGYAALAHKCFSTLNFPGFSIKPKIHLLRHSEHELVQWLSNPQVHYILNPLAFGCEQNEDFIGRACRLSRRCDTRTLCVRVLQSITLKGDMLHRKWVKFGPVKSNRRMKKKLRARLKTSQANGNA